jgi:aspartate/methionine/tyrosine aminotransferase
MGDEQAAAACSEQSAAADDVAFCKALVKRAGVVAVPGSAFGPRGAGWVRLSYGNQPPEQIDRACDRMLAVRGSRVFASPSSRRR